MPKEKIYIIKYYFSVESGYTDSAVSNTTINKFLETKIIKEGKGIDIQIKKLEASIKGFELVDIREI